VTEQELAEIEARANAATAGPWVYDGGGGRHNQRVLATRAPDGVVMDNEPYYPQMVAPADQEFCAAARTDVPALVAEVRRLRALVKEAYEEGARDADPYGAGDAVWEHSHAHKALEGA
jgi:hypothetical protein